MKLALWGFLMNGGFRMSIDKTKLAKGKGLLADAHTELCGLMNAFTYDGMGADVAGPWFAKVKGLLDSAASSMGIGMSSKSKLMTMPEFEQHLASQFALAKKDHATIAKMRMDVLQQAITAAKAGFKTPEDKVEIPVFEKAAEPAIAAAAVPAAAPPAPPAPVVPAEPPKPALSLVPASPATVVEPVVELAAPVVEPTPEEIATTEAALQEMNKRVAALEVVAGGVAKQAHKAQDIDDLMNAVDWPEDMATEASMRGDDPHEALSKSDESFGCDPWVKVKPQIAKPAAQPAAK